ncbi:MAG: MotA/TolQ/ExbB proton channel family protein [Planctomycetaceae bacterium]|nr:MotA/TolQ/ExbB proton channel family protein [Planctomycetaceae bacterium]
MKQAEASSPNPFVILLTSPFPWALLGTWGLYLILPSIPVGRDLLTRYLSSHPLEYVLSALFLTGLSIISIKALMLVREYRAFRALREFGDGSAETFAIAAERYSQRAAEFPRSLCDTYWGRRLIHLQSFFDGQKSGDGLHDHVSYLADAESERLHASHSLLQTVIWAIPILGFLGTVMGITLAIANVTPDQLDSSLDEVTGGLAVAFDTTAVALTFSLVLGFASLFIKRAEEQLLTQIDESCRLELHRCFPAASSGENPLSETERTIAAELLHRSTSIVDSQTKLWGETVQAIRDQWQSTIEQQRDHLAEAIADGTQTTLGDHAEQLASVRREFLQAQEELQAGLREGLHQLADCQQQATVQLQSVIQSFAQELNSTAQEQSEQRRIEQEQFAEALNQHFSTWTAEVSGWQRQLREVSEAILAQNGQRKSLASQEESLLRLQQSLNQNLEAIRTSEAFEETLHSLSAAVHLLTTKTRVRDAA